MVTYAEAVFAAMDAGLKQRKVGVTNMNDRSSRSHTIFRITVESCESMEEQQDEAGEGTGEVVSGGRAIMLAHLNLVRAPQTLNIGSYEIKCVFFKRTVKVCVSCS